MAGYVDKSVAAYQKTMAEASAGSAVTKAIKALQDKAQIRDSLKPLPARGALTANRKLAKPTGASSSGGGGIASPLTEQPETRKFYEAVRELTSSDGLFVVEYQNPLSITTKDALSREIKIIFDDPDSW
jgi:hypothetical protein